MKKIFTVGLILFLLLSIGATAYATNGTSLIGIGPISRSMGGVGIAAPQDPISAVFANPAAMCFGPYCPRSEFNIAGTIFIPTTRARIRVPHFNIDTSARSKSDLFIIPAIGVSTPIDQKWRFGFAAYGISGMGVDYKKRLDIDPQTQGSQGDIFTDYMVMKFAPNIAYMVNNNFSVGVSIHADYAKLDLGEGSSNGYGAGVQAGMIYKMHPISIGLSYISPQSINHKNVADLDNDGTKDNLKLEIPQNIGIGIAYEPTTKTLIEVNAKWINWNDARGYKDFDWKDQWVYSFGIQHKLSKPLALRAGFNYGKNPVKMHNGFDSTTFTRVQGKSVNTFQYEYLRIIGFPAVVEKHVSFGMGYHFSQRFAVNLGYTHAFGKKITERGIKFGQDSADVFLSSKLKINTFEFGLSWRF